MSETEIDAKGDTTETVDVTLTESSPDHEIINQEDEDGFISTDFTEATKVETQVETEKVKVETDTVETTTQKTETDLTKQTPFHEHPDWQKMVQSKNDANTRADAADQKIADLEAKTTPQQQKVINLMSMDDEKLSDMIVNDPKQYTALVAQQLDSEQTTRATATAKQDSEAQKLADVQKGYVDYFADKSDGQGMLTDGTIKRYIDDHPGHNPISAYQEITSEATTKTKIETAVKEAVEESEKKIYATLKSKGIAASPATSTTSASIKDITPKVNTGSKGSIKAAMAALVRQRNAG